MAIELYKHNKKAYSNVLEHFETTNRTCVVHATGTGKSFISLKWLEDNKDKKCLYLAPTNAIIDQFKTHIEDNGLSLSDFPNLEFELYTNVSRRIADNKYDCIVMDEFHRCGAKEWGIGINKLLDNNEDAKVLGLSATPIRYLDDNRNMADEIFNGDIASEISLPEAIAIGILPAPIYITSIYSFDYEIEKIQDEIDKYKNKEEKEELQNRLNEAKNMLEKSRGLSEVFEKYITNKRGKYIVFCRDQKHMGLMEEKSNEWFKNINKIKEFEVYYGKSPKLNKYAIDSFENDDSDELKLLFAIEMLNEGVHVKTIDGVIMFRPTSSPIVYSQQMGRGLSVGHNEHPIIFDIVNNYECLDQIHTLKEDVKKIIDKAIDDINNGKVPFDGYVDIDEDKMKNILNSFIIIDCNKDIKQILDKLDNDLEISFDQRLKEVADYLKSEEGQNIIYANKINKKFSSGTDMANWLRSNKQKIIDASNVGNEDALYIVQRFKWLEDKIILSFEQRLKEVADYLKSEEGQNITSYSTINKKFSSGFDMLNWINKNKPKIIEVSNENEDALYIAQRFEWFEEKVVLSFEQRLKEVADYLKSEEGQNIIYAKKINKKFSSGTDMANWINDNKPKIIEVSNENEDALYIIQRFDWTLSLSKEKLDWNGMYELAKEFYMKNGSLKISKRFKTVNGYEYDEDGIALGSWIATQRGAYKGQKGILTSEQIKMLEDIGMEWFDDKTDDKLQSQIIDEKNKLKKQKEILNRFNSLLNNYDGESLPSKEDMNNDFIDQLNRMTR